MLLMSTDDVVGFTLPAPEEYFVFVETFLNPISVVLAGGPMVVVRP